MSDAASEPQDEAPEDEAPQDGASWQAVPPDWSGGVLLASPAAGAAPVIPPEELLVSHSFGDAARLLPSAAVARRVLLQAIRARHRLAGRPKRRRLLACMGGAALPPELASDGDVEAVPDDEGAIRAAIDPQTAGLFIAPVRLAGGLNVVSGAVLAALREMADEYGLALVFDETAAGLGRTGMAFAHEWTGVTPDLMLVGDGAGLPVAALILSDKFARALPAPLPAAPEEERARAGSMLAAAMAPGFEARVQNLGWLLEDRLARLRYGRPDLFVGLAGTGLVQGLLCAGPAEGLAERLAAAGLMTRAVGAVLAVLPPLDVTEEEMTAGLDRLDAIIAQMAPNAAPA